VSSVGNGRKSTAFIGAGVMFKTAFKAEFEGEDYCMALQMQHQRQLQRL
jgi:hypothetical protein